MLEEKKIISCDETKPFWSGGTFSRFVTITRLFILFRIKDKLQGTRDVVFSKGGIFLLNLNHKIDILLQIH
jgi:hypothetical protein